MVKVVDLGQAETQHFMSFLLYGRSGVGKTRLAAQFPKPLILACDPGPTKGALSAKPFNPKVIFIDHYKDFLEAIEVAKELIAKGEIKTVVLDSATYLAKIIMQDILRPSGKEIPRLEEWNLAQRRLLECVNLLGELDCHQVITATEQIVRDEILGKTYGLPNVPGKLAHDLPPVVDVCLHLTARAEYTARGRRVIYTMHSQPDDIWEAKDRTGMLPPEMETDIKYILPLLGEEQTKEEEVTA